MQTGKQRRLSGKERNRLPSGRDSWQRHGSPQTRLLQRRRQRQKRKRSRWQKLQKRRKRRLLRR